MAQVAGKIKFEGMVSIISNLEKTNANLKSVAAQALHAAAKPIVSAARMRVSVDTGLTKKSLGAVSRRHRSRWPYEVIGPRTGFEDVINGRKRNPAKTAHLLEGGTAPHSLKTAVDMRIIRRGRNVFSYFAAKQEKLSKVGLRKHRDTARRLAMAHFYRRDKAAGKAVHPGAAKKPFLAPALEASGAMANTIIANYLRRALAKQEAKVKSSTLIRVFG